MSVTFRHPSALIAVSSAREKNWRSSFKAGFNGFTYLKSQNVDFCDRHSEVNAVEKKFRERDLLEGMRPEAYHGRTEEVYDPSDNETRKRQNDWIDTTYPDLVGRIDRFLNDPSPPPDDAVRKGTQSKVRESLQVIQKAIKDYG